MYISLLCSYLYLLSVCLHSSVSYSCCMMYEFNRIYHECKDGIEKSIPRITNWHHKACHVMITSDRQGRLFLSHPHTNNVLFFLAHH